MKKSKIITKKALIKYGFSPYGPNCFSNKSCGVFIKEMDEEWNKRVKRLGGDKQWKVSFIESDDREAFAFKITTLKELKHLKRLLKNSYDTPITS